VPEASGAAWVVVDGKPLLAVISDSGNHGAYGLVDPETGATTLQGQIPLGNLGDDFEGLASRHGELFGILSPGYVVKLAWHDGALGASAPHALGPQITGNTHQSAMSDRPITDPGVVCGGVHNANCGRNFEGFCLDDSTAYTRGPCAGFVAAKSDGKLFCVRELDGAYTVDTALSIEVAKPGQLADCAFDDTGRLWVGNNLFGASTVSRIDNWQDPSHAKVVPLGSLGTGFPEVIAARGDIIYRMSDTGGSPSLMTKFRCPAATR